MCSSSLFSLIRHFWQEFLRDFSQQIGFLASLFQASRTLVMGLLSCTFSDELKILAVASGFQASIV